MTLELASGCEDLEAICAQHGIVISANRVRKAVRRFGEEKDRSAAWRRILEQTTGALLRQTEQA